MRSHSGRIEQLQNQLQLKGNVQKELDRQACIIAEVKGQLGSSETSWHKEMSHQVSMCTGLFVYVFGDPEIEILIT